MAKLEINEVVFRKRIKDFAELTKNTCNEIIEVESRKIEDGTKSLASARIHMKSGQLIAEIGRKVTREKDGTIKATIFSKATSPKPKRPGLHNIRMKNRYKHGTPYPKILEFSPKFGHTKTTYSKYAHLYPVVDREKPVFYGKIVSMLKEKYSEIYGKKK